MKQAQTTDHYLTLIQAARHTAEETFRLAKSLPLDLVATYRDRAERKLETGLELLAALPAHPLRGTALVDELVTRTRLALAGLSAFLAKNA